MHGAAYGSGIYLSPRSATSFGYTRGYSNSKSQTVTHFITTFIYHNVLFFIRVVKL